MDRLGAMRVFAAVVEARGFSAASRALGMTLPTTCRKVAELEAQLGTQLLTRSTRRVTVTDAGQRYHENVIRILEEIEDAERQARGEYQQAKGLLTLTAPSLFGRLHVLPIVTGFMRRHEDIEVRLLFTNHMLDLPDEHIDLGIRVGAVSHGSMTVAAAGTVRQIVCASPDFLDAEGRPQTPQALPGQKCITFTRSGRPAPWTFRMPTGKRQSVDVKSKLVLNSAEGAIDSALGHAGMTQLYSYQAAPHVANGALEIVLPDYEIEPVPINVVYPHGERLPQKVKFFLDFAMPQLREDLVRVDSMCA